MPKTKIIPKSAHLIPKDAKLVFRGTIHDIYQWDQKMFDGSSAKFEMIKRPDTAVAAIVQDDEIMLLRQIQPDWDKPKYGFPGGRVDPGETPLEAIKREVEEETGRTYKNWRLINAYQPQEKMERFNYMFLATGEVSRKPIHNDGGEIIEEPEFVSLQKLAELAESESRLVEWKHRPFRSIQDLLEAPEYEGREVEI